MKKLTLKFITLVTTMCLLLTFGCAPKTDVPQNGTSDTPTGDTTTSEVITSDTTTPEITTAEEESDDEVKFLIFADFHYKKKMYASNIEDMNKLLERANNRDVDFVIHLGDFCNDYIGSPELFEAYLNNKYDIPVFGVLGNHELESSGNSMKIITPRLSNADVSFGADGAGYWYYDIKNFRLIGLDTNYSHSTTDGWMHNKTASHTYPSGNTLGYSLSPDQIEWLEKTIADASEKGMKALIFSHAGFATGWYASPDAVTVRSIFRKYPNTVMLASNGHLHTDRFEVIENVAYFDVNACINAYWKQSTGHHYTDEHTFTFTNYVAGKAQEPKTMCLKDLTQGKNTWFLEDPLSAVVTVNADGNIDIDGSVSAWRYGIAPPTTSEAVKAMILSRSAKLKMD